MTILKRQAGPSIGSQRDRSKRGWMHLRAGKAVRRSEQGGRYRGGNFGLPDQFGRNRLRFAQPGEAGGVHPPSHRQCRYRRDSVDLVSSHATSTPQGDEQECKALRNVFGEKSETLVNNTKSFIGHSMGLQAPSSLRATYPPSRTAMRMPRST